MTSMHSPLAGKRVLVTRPRGQGSALATQLEALGATPILIPTIELAPPASFCVLDAALSSLRAYDWLLFTSANAVHALVQRAGRLGLQPSPRRIAAIGPATARAVIETGLAPAVDLMPSRYVAESFVEALTPYAADASMLLVRAAVARDLLPDALTGAGATITVAEAYQTIIPPDSIRALSDVLGAIPVALDAVTFTSASTATNLVALLEAGSLVLPREIALASIGPITTQAMSDLGLAVSIEASESTIASLVAALASHFWG